MNVSEAVEIITKSVRETGTSASQATKQLWEEISPIPEDEAVSLMQQAISGRVGDCLRNPEDGAILSFRNTAQTFMTPVGDTDPEPVRTITIQRERTPIARHEVTVKLLSYTIYHVNGEAKPISEFTRYDVNTKLSTIQKIESGVMGHRKMWEYVGDRMKALHKSKVADLAEGEQIKIARMVYDLRQTHNLIEGV